MHISQPAISMQIQAMKNTMVKGR
ncbi:helix-turn-helix domain-containing protein [Zhaonella formicivorans]